MLGASTDLPLGRQSHGTSLALGTQCSDPNVAAGIDGFIRAMSSEDLKKWTTQVYKQSRSGIWYPEQDFLLSEPVTEVTDAHRKMPHLPLLSPDADLLAALLKRNQFLEE